jgi:hypothetical protein
MKKKTYVLSFPEQEAAEFERYAKIKGHVDVKAFFVYSINQATKKNKLTDEEIREYEERAART